jgi:hypothetical protein
VVVVVVVVWVQVANKSDDGDCLSLGEVCCAALRNPELLHQNSYPPHIALLLRCRASSVFTSGSILTGLYFAFTRPKDKDNCFPTRLRGPYI